MSKIASTVHQVRHPADPDRHSRPADSSPDRTGRHRRDDQRRSSESSSHHSRRSRRASSSPRHSRATSHQRSDRGQSPEIVLSTRRHDSDGRRSSPDRRRGRHRSRSPLRQQESSSSRAAHHASSSRRASSSARDPSPPATASQTSGRDRASRRPDSESTLTASSPHQQRRTPPEQPPPRVTVTPRRRPQPPRDQPRTPPGVIYVPEILELPRTPGHFSSPDNSPGLDLTRAPRRQLPPPSPGDSDRPWDQFSAVSEGPTASEHQEQPETPLTWTHVVDLVYRSGMVDPSTVPTSPEPVRSVIGGPLPVEKRRVALPPSPLTTACLSSAMKSCWGGPWPTSSQHQPPPPNTAIHPGPSTWVPDYKARFHSAPGLDLRPARLSAREKEWAGTAQPPINHSWMVDIETMARAQLASLSNLEWLFGIYLQSHSRATPAELEALKGYTVKELQHAINFSGAQIAAATLARRQAILEPLHRSLNHTTRNWLQLQPVDLRTHQGLFGTASAQIPEIMRQQPVPREAPPRRPAAPRPQPRRDQPRQQSNRAPQTSRRPAATYTPTAAATAAETTVEKPTTTRPRGQATSTKGAKVTKQRT